MTEPNEQPIRWNEDKLKPCLTPGHEFPSHLYIPPGQTYKHVCPGCHQETVVTAPNITW